MKKMQQRKQYGRRICKILVPGDWVKSCSSMIFFSVFILVGVWQQYLRSCSWPVRPRAVVSCATAADDQTGWSIGLWTSTAGEPVHLYWRRVPGCGIAPPVCRRPLLQPNIKFRQRIVLEVAHFPINVHSDDLQTFCTNESILTGVVFVLFYLFIAFALDSKHKQ